jgi:hypothetical protein
MKRILFILLVFAAIMATCTESNAQRYEAVYTKDTLTNTETINLDFDQTFRDYGKVECGVNANNLSGTSAITAKLQVAYTGAETVWFTLDTLAVVDSTNAVISAEVFGNRVRLALTGTDTQTTDVDCYCGFKRIP